MLKKMAYIFISLVFSISIYAQVIGEVSLIKGKAFLIDEAGKELSALNKSTTISLLDTVQVSKKSIIKFKMKDGSSLMLPENSVMKFEKYIINDDKRESIVSLIKGKVRAKIKKFKGQEEYNENNRFIIKTKMAAIGVRGTEFLVNSYLVANKPVTDSVLLSGKINADVVGSSIVDMVPGQAINSTEYIATGKLRVISQESLGKLILNQEAFLPNVQLPDGSFIDLDSEIKNVKAEAPNATEGTSEATAEAPTEAPTKAPVEETAQSTASNSTASTATTSATTAAPTAVAASVAAPSVAAPSVSIVPSAISAPASIPVTGLSPTSSALSTLIPKVTAEEAIRYITATAWDVKDALDNRKKLKQVNECYYWVYEKQGDDPVFERYRKEKDCDEFEFDYEN